MGLQIKYCTTNYIPIDGNKTTKCFKARIYPIQTRLAEGYELDKWVERVIIEIATQNAATNKPDGNLNLHQTQCSIYRIAWPILVAVTTPIIKIFHVSVSRLGLSAASFGSSNTITHVEIITHIAPYWH